MKKFSAFLAEDYVVLYEESGKANDDKGKAFELEFAKAIHPKKEYPTHYRDETGKRPHEVAARIRGDLGGEHYKSIEGHATKAAAEYRQHLHDKKILHKDKKPDIVAWTSQPSDHEKFTGKKDPHTNADTMIRHGRKYRAQSLKYGAAPGVRSPGLKDLSSLAKVDHKHAAAHVAAHDAAVDNVMKKHIKSTSKKVRNKDFREIESSGTPAAKKAATDAQSVSLSHRQALAGHYAKHFGKLSTEDMHHVVRHLTGAEDNVHPHDKVHYDTKRNQVHISNPNEDHKKLVANVHHYSVEHQGTNVVVHAHDHAGKKHKIMSVQIKNNSSPMSVVGASVKLAPGHKKLAGKEAA